MRIWPRPMQREVPITDPRWLASTQPDREPEPKPDVPKPVVKVQRPVHWLHRESDGIWPYPLTSIPCSAGDGEFDYNQDNVTCPRCLSSVVRYRCLDLEPVPWPLPRRCGLRRHHLGRHDWETDSAALPRRTPGAALGDAEGSSGVRVPAESARAAESNVEREVLETWTA